MNLERRAMRRQSFVRHSVPPHPNPLPQGEGIPCAALGGIETLGSRDQRRTFLPLPGAAGEASATEKSLSGRGEGGRRFIKDRRLFAVHGSWVGGALNRKEQCAMCNLAGHC